MSATQVILSHKLIFEFLIFSCENEMIAFYQMTCPVITVSWILISIEFINSQGDL